MRGYYKWRSNIVEDFCWLMNLCNFSSLIVGTSLREDYEVIIIECIILIDIEVAFTFKGCVQIIDHSFSTNIITNNQNIPRSFNCKITKLSKIDDSYKRIIIIIMNIDNRTSILSNKYIVRASINRYI